MNDGWGSAESPSRTHLQETIADCGVSEQCPPDFPAWDRVYAFFRRWRDKGLVAEFHDRLRDWSVWRRTR